MPILKKKPATTRSLPALPVRALQQEELEHKFELYKQLGQKVPADDRRRLPLPRKVSAAEEEHLSWSLSPMMARDGAGSSGERPLPACTDATMSMLGVGLCRLVAIGGRDAEGEVLPAATLVCDPWLRIWSPLGAPSTLGGETSAMSSLSASPIGARAAHAVTVVGHARSLLVVAGGEDALGDLLGDVHVLEMRALETAEGSERRRELAPGRRALLDTLMTLRGRQRAMRRSLVSIQGHASHWKALLVLEEEAQQEQLREQQQQHQSPSQSPAKPSPAKPAQQQQQPQQQPSPHSVQSPVSDDALSPTRELSPLERLKNELHEMRREMFKLKKELELLDTKADAALSALEQAGGGGAVEWRWLKVEMPFEPSEEALAELEKKSVHLGAPSAGLEKLITISGGGIERGVSFVPRRHHTIAATGHVLWSFGGEIRSPLGSRSKLGGEIRSPLGSRPLAAHSTARAPAASPPVVGVRGVGAGAAGAAGAATTGSRSKLGSGSAAASSATWWHRTGIISGAEAAAKEGTAGDAKASEASEASAASEEASSSAFLTSVRSEGALPTTKAAATNPSAAPSAAPSSDPSADPSAPPSSARPDLRKPPKKDDWVDRESPQYIAGVLLGRMAKIEAMGYPEVIQAAMEHAAAHPPLEEEEAAAVVALMRHGPRPRSPMGLSFALEEALANDDAAAIEQASTAIAKYERAVAEKAAAEKAAAEKAAAQQAAKEKAEAERAKLEKARANAPLSKAERMRLAEKAAAEKAAAENGAAAAPAPAPALALATEPDVVVYTAHVTMALPPPPPPPAPVNEFILSDDFLCAKMERLALPDDGFHHREVAVPTVRLVWRRLRTHGRPPPARCAHAMCVSGAVAGISARLLVHGGVGYEVLSDEVRLLRLPVDAPPALHARDHHGATALSPQVRLLRLPVDDRTRARIVLNDLHVLEPSTGTWSQPELCGWPATKRAFHCMQVLTTALLPHTGAAGRRRNAPSTACTRSMAESSCSVVVMVTARAARCPTRRSSHSQGARRRAVTASGLTAGCPADCPSISASISASSTPSAVPSGSRRWSPRRCRCSSPTRPRCAMGRRRWGRCRQRAMRP